MTAETLSLDSTERMASAAADVVSRGALLLKIKPDHHHILEKVAAIRAAVPKTTLIIDANEAWDGLDLPSLFTALQAYDIAMVKQPLPAGQEGNLLHFPHPIPLCADESCHNVADIAALRDCYEMIDIKLDRCGGLTEALAMVAAARQQHIRLMVGCMLSAEYVDLDGPIRLAADSSPFLSYSQGRIWL